jgi:hypothetical protein
MLPKMWPQPECMNMLVMADIGPEPLTSGCAIWPGTAPN